jgi:hypothetical protein
MEPESSLRHSQQPTTCPSSEPDRSSLYPHPTYRKSILILGLPNGLLSSGFPSRILYAPPLSPIRATRPAHLSLLYLITRIISGEAYRAKRSLL